MPFELLMLDPSTNLNHISGVAGCQLEPVGAMVAHGAVNQAPDKWLMVKDGDDYLVIIYWGNDVGSIPYRCTNAPSATTMSVSWSIPVARENGDALTLDEIEGYVLTVVVDDPNVTELKIIGADQACVDILTVAGVASEPADEVCVP